jgi:Ca-activated chloride channel family protein
LTKEEETFLTVSFNSKFDGEGIKTHGRPALNLVVALDISGSMALPFTGEEHKSKIQVAKECISALITRLKPEDRFGLVLFNDKPTVFQKLQKWSDIDVKVFSDKLSKLRATGGTEISSALIKAKAEYQTVPEEKNVSNRIFFLTDMEVGKDDGMNFTDLVDSNSKEAIWSTVVGIGLDLGSDVITRVSSTAGCNYSNVRSSTTFREFVESEFDYSVTAIGYGIQVEFQSDEVSINTAYGSYELRSIPKGSKKVLFSTEFPVKKNSEGEARGGVMLFKLDGAFQDKGFTISTSWQNQNGITKTKVQELTIPSKDTYQSISVRKAVLLHYYASFMRKYVDLRLDQTPEGFKQYVEARKQFPILYTFFEKEMNTIGDTTLTNEYSMMEQFAKDDDIPLDKSSPVLPTILETDTTMENTENSLKRKHEDPEQIPDESKRIEKKPKT